MNDDECTDVSCPYDEQPRKSPSPRCQWGEVNYVACENEGTLPVEIQYWLPRLLQPRCSNVGATQLDLSFRAPPTPTAHARTSHTNNRPTAQPPNRVSTTRQLPQLMLGVFNESKGKLTLSRVKNNAVCRMEPRIHGIEYEPAPQESRREESDSDLRELRLKRNSRLIDAFGSQRRKRQLANAQAGRVDGSQLGGGNAIINLIKSSASASAISAISAISTISKGGAVTKEAFIKQAMAKERNIPPHDPEASTADGAYPFDRIVPGAVRDSIDTSLLQKALGLDADEGDVAETMSGVRRTFGAYVASRVGSQSSFLAADASDTLEPRLTSLAFLGHLLPFYTNPKRLVIKIGPRVDRAAAEAADGGEPAGGKNAGGKNAGGIAGCAEGMKMPTSTLEGILSLFYNREDGDDDSETATTKYVMDKRKRNLLLTWILTLAVRAEPSSFLPVNATKKLVEELKLRPADVAATYRELGMTATRSGQSYSVSLLNGGNGGNGAGTTLGDAFPDVRLPRPRAAK